MTGTLQQRDARKNLRYPIDVPAVVIAERRQHPASIKDISRLGCCVAMTDTPERGDEIAVVIGGLSLVATVAWARDSLLGANFHREIDPLQFVRDHSDHPLLARRRANGMIAMAG